MAKTTKTVTTDETSTGIPSESRDAARRAIADRVASIFSGKYGINSGAHPAAQQIANLVLTNDLNEQNFAEIVKDTTGQVDSGDFEGLKQSVFKTVRPQLSQLKDQFIKTTTTPVTKEVPLTEQEIQDQQQAEAEAKIQARQNAFDSRINELFQQAIETGTPLISREFISPRKELAEQNAVLGRFRSPIAIPQETEIANAEAEAKGRFINQLTGQKLNQQLGLASALEQVRQSQEQARQRASEFSQTFGLQREMFQKSLEQQEKERQLALQLGQLRAKTAQDLQPSAFERFGLPLLGLGSQLGGAFLIGRGLGAGGAGGMGRGLAAGGAAGVA